MNLGKLIHDLLERQQTVFVKNLGTFKRTHTSASFDAKRKVMLPPINFIEFEYQTEEGYDFTLHYQQTNQLDRDEAELDVQEAVNHLADAINKDGQVSLDELGQLVSYGYAFIFKPLDLSGFQYVPIPDPYIKEEEEKAISNTEEEYIHPLVEEQTDIIEGDNTISEEVLYQGETGNEEKIIEEPPVDQVSTSDSVEKRGEDSEENVEDEYPRKSNRGWIYALITILALVGLGFILYNIIIKKELDSVNKNLVPLDSIESNSDSIPSGKDSANILLGDSLLNDSLAQPSNFDDLTGSKIEEEATDDIYTIVIGTHPKLEQAEAEAAEYNRKGYKHVRAIASNLAGNRKKVIWDIYPTKELRDSALRYVHKNINKDAWPTELK